MQATLSITVLRHNSAKFAVRNKGSLAQTTISFRFSEGKGAFTPLLNFVRTPYYIYGKQAIIV